MSAQRRHDNPESINRDKKRWVGKRVKARHKTVHKVGLKTFVTMYLFYA